MVQHTYAYKLNLTGQKSITNSLWSKTKQRMINDACWSAPGGTSHTATCAEHRPPSTCSRYPELDELSRSLLYFLQLWAAFMTRVVTLRRWTGWGFMLHKHMTSVLPNRRWLSCDSPRASSNKNILICRQDIDPQAEDAQIGRKQEWCREEA